MTAPTSARSVTVRAPAKINLVLGVGPVRDDGYHPLDTVYQAISLYDDITVSTAAGWSVGVEPIGDVDVSEVPLDETNIVVRAGVLLTEHHGIARRASIGISKGIPVAGGMAGGSADAAATLVALDRLWDLRTSDEDLLAIAAELGSDVPFALLGGTAHGTGRGELVESVGDAGTWWWVVVPNATGMSTPAVYAAFDDHGGGGSDSAAVLAALAGTDLDALTAGVRNDLQSVALELRADLRLTESDLVGAGARAALLSGSGPTFLGLVEDQDSAHEVREALLDAGHPGVLVATGPVAGAHVVQYA
ncbi:4-(cytidine 5'-diphospho)-2-C-methyl-D-erythritol kinase [Nocardioides marmoriginsengisoli]|uniref:4-diphosphocytidyl-2-C-methyl-D-erythritol kinase n=1 Tax=Nocardioides marmoriginsengisoli TaxID=661483 RepID=A0A3N0CHR4_9ACTN|nr:4-(cytidine 5'-diphospho)-2-C-methyl-D-erythritol kinase [Nocardioides marmoriginsengisoli]RNL62566.1 4-(cytidine 5'-diphospho)-2-C-methyl-D-erythritol kinase [Nocardioides marmoriginsengisoli]